jgi:hypothetical protein
MGAANFPTIWPRPSSPYRGVSVGGGYTRDEEEPPKRLDPKPLRKRIFSVAGWIVIATIFLGGGIAYCIETTPKPTDAAIAIAKSLDEHPNEWVRDRYFDGTLVRTSNGQVVSLYGYNDQATRVSLNGRKLSGFDPYAPNRILGGVPTVNQVVVWKAKIRWNKRQEALQAAGRNTLDRETVDALK